MIKLIVGLLLFFTIEANAERAKGGGGFQLIKAALMDVDGSIHIYHLYGEEIHEALSRGYRVFLPKQDLCRSTEECSDVRSAQSFEEVFLL